MIDPEEQAGGTMPQRGEEPGPTAATRPNEPSPAVHNQTTMITTAVNVVRLARGLRDPVLRRPLAAAAEETLAAAIERCGVARPASEASAARRADIDKVIAALGRHVVGTADPDLRDDLERALALLRRRALLG